jgi:hypothetical protein
MQENPKTQHGTTHGNLRSFYGWLDSIDKTRTTGWRWRKEGLIKTVNIFGKLYVTTDEIARFESRAIAGEFHKEIVAPCHRVITRMVVPS